MCFNKKNVIIPMGKTERLSNGKGRSISSLPGSWHLQAPCTLEQPEVAAWRRAFGHSLRDGWTCLTVWWVWIVICQHHPPLSCQIRCCWPFKADKLDCHIKMGFNMKIVTSLADNNWASVWEPQWRGIICSVSQELSSSSPTHRAVASGEAVRHC